MLLDSVLLLVLFCQQEHSWFLLEILRLTMICRAYVGASYVLHIIVGVTEPAECVLDGDEITWVTFDALDSMATNSRKEDTWVIFDAVLGAMQRV